MKRTVFIVEDHDVVRESYVMFITMQAGLDVCGAVRTAEEALDRLPDADPDLLLVDVSLPGMSGIELLEALQASEVQLPALVLTGHDNDVYRRRALQAGAEGFVMKQDGPDMLMKAIRRVLRVSQSDAE